MLKYLSLVIYMMKNDFESEKSTTTPRIRSEYIDIIGALNGKPYHKLTRVMELNLIKKSKLSFYYDVEEQDRETYLDYYFEFFPLKKKRYLSIVSKINELLQELEMQKEAGMSDCVVECQRKIDQLEGEKCLLLEKYIDHSRNYRDQFLERNIRLVMSVVSRINSYGLSYDDILSEGLMGLMDALKKFDVDSGNMFSTYAVWLIMKRATYYVLNNRDDIRISVHLGEKINQIQKASAILIHTLYREPTISELSQVTGYSEKEVKRLVEYNYLSKTSRLDDVVAEGSDLTLTDMIGEDDFGFEIVDEEIFLHQVEKFIKDADLTELERAVFGKKSGLDDGITYTFREIGEEIGLPNNQTRNIGLAAIKKLKTAAVKTGFFDYDKINDGVKTNSRDEFIDSFYEEDDLFYDDDYEELKKILRRFS